MIIKETNLPKVSFSSLTKNKFDLRETGRDSCDVISAQNENNIELTIDNFEINGIREYIEFDVMAKTNTPGLKFGKGFLVLKYSEKIGRDLISNNSIQITKGNIIKNDLYKLHYQDINSSNLVIKIDPEYPSDSMYTFTNNAESILHFRLNLNEFIHIEEITQKDIKVLGNLFYWCIDDYYKYDRIDVDGGYKPSSPTDDPIGIEYTFENGSTTPNNSTFSIDLFAKATASSLYSDAFIYIDYNDIGFGDNVIVNGSFTFEQKDLLANSDIYEIYLYDYDDNTLLLLVVSSNDFTQYQTLSITPRKLGVLNFSVLDCDDEKGLGFDPQTISADHVHYTGNGVTGYEYYDPVVADDEENGKICGCEKPEITSFSPTIIPAGTGDILTINGNNFGNYEFLKSKVLFRDGDDSFGEVETKKAHFLWDNIIHWNDTEIKVKVPSVTGGSFFHNPAATGKFKVENNCGEIGQSQDILEIPYSIINIQKPGASVQDRKLIIENDNSSGGIVFKFSSIIHTNGIGQIIRSAFTAALEEWCAKTNINFTFGEDTNETEPKIDDINIITYGEISSQHGVAGLKISGHYGECDDDTELINNLDFIIEEGNENIGFTEYKSRFLHELGHAHMLNHSIAPYWNNDWNYQYLMYYQSPPNNHQSTITGADKDGALLVFPNSALCGSGIGSGSCGSTSITALLFEDIKLFPNPVSYRINIENKSNHKISEIKLLNIFGETIFGSFEEFDHLQFEDYPDGVYFINLTLDIGKTLNFKVIKQ